MDSEANKERFNFLRLKKIREEKVRQEKFNRKICERKKLKLRSPLEVGEEVLVLASRLKKKKIHLENFTRVVLITSLTFTSQRHF